MADLRIVDAPEIPTENITGEEKLPTGGNGNYSITLDSLADYTKTKKDLVDNTSVDGKVNGVRQELDAHIEDLLNPHQVTKGQIGLGNVDNTADADKPVSNSTQAAIISAVSPKADKTYVDGQLALKANKVDVYTKLETYTKQESSDLVDNSISIALTPVNSSLDLVKRGVANHYDSSLTYNSGDRVVLANGDIVKSTVDGNVNDPNVNMTGWVKTNSTSQIFDESGLSQHEINNTKKYVPLVSDLKKISAKNGDIVGTNGHTQVGLGGGLYRFEALSSKVDNNGAWIASTKSAGTWVLISESFVEQWGVMPENIDQSSKIQSCIDFNFDNGIHEYGFEKSNAYYISNPIVFKQRPISWGGAYSDPKFKTTFNFNGARLVAKTNNMTMIGVSRDLVRLNNPSFNVDSGVQSVIAIYNGLLTENSNKTLRRSSMRMYLDNPSFDGVDVAMKFEPAETMFGGQWGSFYHTVVNPTAINTQIMYEFRQSKGAGDCSNTRNTFIGTKHVGGACTIYGEALESSIFLGIESEFINRPDARLPDGEAVGLYLPFGTPSDFQANKQNKFIGFNIEVCTNYINVDAPGTHIDGYFQGATNARVTAWKYNNGFGNLSYTEGGMVLRQYNSTPRFGLQQINDNGTTESFYLERGVGTGDYKLSCDGKLRLTNTVFDGYTQSNNQLFRMLRSDGSYYFYIDFTSDYFPSLSSSTGELGISATLIPTTDNNINIGSAGNRLGKLYTGRANISSLSTFSDNASAITGGLAIGDLYKTSTGQLMVVF